MTRITISLPEELADAVGREARRRGVPVSEIARQALAARLGLGEDGTAPPLRFAGLGRSGHSDTARRAEEILSREWAPGAHAAARRTEARRTGPRRIGARRSVQP